MQDRREIFHSKHDLIYFGTAALALAFWMGGLFNRPLDDIVFGLSLAFFILIIIYLSVINTYLEIKNGRRLINSGYFSLSKQETDIFDIKYIYRYPHFILKWYGSRMVFYVKMPDNKLKQVSLREANYSNETLRGFLKRLLKINPRIELDPEYEKFLAEKLWLEDASENTIESVEARLRKKGETWE